MKDQVMPRLRHHPIFLQVVGWIPRLKHGWESSAGYTFGYRLFSHCFLRLTDSDETV
jgi:hypothetical protein